MKAQYCIHCDGTGRYWYNGREVDCECYEDEKIAKLRNALEKIAKNNCGWCSNSFIARQALIKER